MLYDSYRQGLPCSHTLSGDCQHCFLHDDHESNADREVKREPEGAIHQSHVYMALIKLWATKGQSVFSGVK